MIRAPARLTTERLTLRPPRAGDAERIFERYASDPEVTRYLSWPRHRSVADSRRFVELSDADWQRLPAGPYLIFDRVDGVLLGGTGLAFPAAAAGRPGAEDEEAERSVETGYVLARDAWGRGIATEALRAMVGVATDCGASRLHALCHTDHRPSWRVLEKCGFERVARLPQHTVFPNLGIEPLDVFRYVRPPSTEEARQGS